MKLFTIALSVCLQVVVVGQQYRVDWFKVAGGGEVSIGGQYGVSGTIGQQDAAGRMTGGSFSMTGGFWSIIGTPKTAGVPTLSIAITRTNTVVVSWPSPSFGFGLQQTSSLQTTNWTNADFTIIDDGTTKSVVVYVQAEPRFYRLKR